jgi:twitching motility protein PilT
MVDIKTILEKAVEQYASDVHINVGMEPLIRKNTELIKMDFPATSNEDAKKMLLSMIGQERFNKFEDRKDHDFSTTIESGYRFRVNAHFQRDTIAMSFRIIPTEVPPFETLHLPDLVKDLSDMPRGLVLVTGHTGSGKSTTLAAMIGLINRKYTKRVITVEDPIEYLLSNELCQIEQRELGADVPDFASGLKHVLRQDPDIIMVGEMRDLETTSSAITAAETGHLVLSTLHTINATQTVERVIDIYPASQQNTIRTMLANTLKAVVSQTLFKRIDKPGMVPCTEILICTSAVRNCIRENRIHEIPNIIETSGRLGMHSMDASIAEMYRKGYIECEEAISRSSDAMKMERLLLDKAN